MTASVQAGCIGCGLCTGTCPQVFALNAEHIAEVVTAEIPAECVESAQEARDGCPVSVIDLCE